MKIGVPKEIKNHEYRVGLTPASVREFVAHGHSVMVQAGAGAAIGLDDAHYRAAGATLVDTAQEVFRAADMIVKVKEPQPQECAMLRPGQLLYTYLHLAPDRSRPRRSCVRARCAWPTRRSPAPTAGCRCWRR